MKSKQLAILLSRTDVMGEKNHKKLFAIGLMSGSSLDGLDLVFVEFELNENIWSFNILAKDCISYTAKSVNKLKEAHLWDIAEVTKLDVDYGHWMGKVVNDFIKHHGITQKIDIIGSHGHTVLHNPAQLYTLQIGHGAAIAQTTGIAVACDLRSCDIALGGQGAPIVPLGEQYLFSTYQAFLNIGGISNISFHSNETVTAFDICPGNTPLNILARALGFDMDKGGLFASKGEIDNELLQQLNNYGFYQRAVPKSLHTSDILTEFMPILKESKVAIADKLATVCEHIAFQIGSTINQYQSTMSFEEIFVTGGGALNDFLINRIQHFSKAKLILPANDIIQFKEALVMAFIGILRLNNEINCLSSVTGASKNSIGGAIYLG